MPRLFRRRSSDEDYDQLPSYGTLPFEDEDAPLMPFVPVESERSFGIEDDDLLEDEPRSRRRGPRVRVVRPRLPRPGVGRPTSSVEVRFGLLVLAAALVVLGIFGTLLNLDRVEADLRELWPVALIGFAALWMLIALVRREIPSFLGAAVLAGAGISLLMAAQDIADIQETLLGVVLVTLGFGIVVRGFLLRQQTYG